jgi:threonine dehydratase
MNAPDVTLRDVYRARKAIAPVVRRTPLVRSEALSERTGAEVHLKLETTQDTGTFKVRGAANKILSLPEEARRRGVITVSTGNHGRAVAHVAGQVGSPAVVCLSTLVPANKVDAVRRAGAEVAIFGKSQDEAAEKADRLAAERGLTMVNPFDDPLVIAGQGTIGLELMDDLPELDAVLVPVGGGGLISGIALALTSVDPAIRVIGVSMERGPVMYHSQQAGKPVLVDEEETLADSLGGGIFLDNQYTFAMVRDLVDDLVLVSEDEIARAMVFALEHEHLVLEGAGAVGVAALLAGKAEGLGRRLALILSGGNVDLAALLKIAGEENRGSGR